jgi:D-serine deaminase-like pyridoxal phosphate-dependent protein
MRAPLTPRLLLDEQRLDRNIRRAAERFEGLALAFRPHLKTHKSPEVMRRQLAAGAAGVTVATLREAEMAIKGGADDVLVAFPPVGRWRLERLGELARKARIIVACTDADQVRALAEHGGKRKPFEYYWEVDCGTGRLGTPPGSSTADTLAPLTDFAGARLAGIMTFPGHSYRAADVRSLREIALAESDALTATRHSLAMLGVDAGILSGGSTPTAWIDEGKAELDEYRCGNYVFFDATQVALGVVTLDDCALTVEATVLSRPADDRFVLDTGSKALPAERISDRTPGFGAVVGHPELVIEALFEEHAICRIDGGRTEVATGARLIVVPNHACTCANLHAEYVVTVRGGGATRWPVEARGWERGAR